MTAAAAPIHFDPVAVVPPDGEWHVAQRNSVSPLWDVSLTNDLAHQVPLPLYLWHYTSRGALQNILRTRCLWATNGLHLEDKREFRFAGQVMRSVLDEVMDEETAPEIRDAVRRVQHIIEHADPSVTPDLYIISFTTHPDNPAIWSLHTRQQEAPVSIGIEGRFLAIHALENWQLRQVFYRDREQREWVRRVIDISLNHLKNGAPQHEVISMLTRAISVLAPVLKHCDFEEEDEWRMIHYPNSYIRHPEGFEPTVHNGPGGIPHIILPFDNLLPPIRITIGPGRTGYPDDENEVVAMAAERRILAIAGRSGCLAEIPHEVNRRFALHNSCLEWWPQQ